MVEDVSDTDSDDCRESKVWRNNWRLSLVIVGLRCLLDK